MLIWGGGVAVVYIIFTYLCSARRVSLQMDQIYTPPINVVATALLPSKFHWDLL